MRGERSCSSCLRPCGYSCDAGSYKRCAEQALVFLIKLVRSVNRLRPYAGSSILFAGMVHNMYRFVGVIEYGDRLHVIAAGLSARAHRVPPAKARLYMASLEEFASKVVASEYGFASIDAYTYVVAAGRFTRGVYSLAGVDKNKSPDYSIARLYLTYEQLCYLLPRILCNLYSSRCSRHYDGHRARHSMCLLASHFCGWEQ